MRPMKPDEFAKILCEKLEKVILDRENADKVMREAGTHISVSICEFSFNVSLFLMGVILSYPKMHRGALMCFNVLGCN